MTHALELGLDTFGDVTLDAAGHPLPQPHVLRNIVDEAVLADRLGLHFFGVVQYIGLERSYDWIEFYKELFGFELIPDEQRFGIMPKGKLLRSPSLAPANGFMLQLIGPDVNVLDAEERLQRIGLGVPDVLAAVKALRQLGIEFVETEAAHTESRGAITKTYLGTVMFELVHSSR